MAALINSETFSVWNLFGESCEFSSYSVASKYFFDRLRSILQVRRYIHELASLELAQSIDLPTNPSGPDATRSASGDLSILFDSWKSQRL